MSREHFFGPGMDHAYYYEGQVVAYRRALAVIHTLADPRSSVGAGLLLQVQELLDEAITNKEEEDKESAL